MMYDEEAGELVFFGLITKAALRVQISGFVCRPWACVQGLLLRGERLCLQSCCNHQMWGELLIRGLQPAQEEVSVLS